MLSAIELKQLFQQPYNRESWIKILRENFSLHDVYANPQRIKFKGENLPAEGYYALGKLITRQEAREIGIYEVQLTGNVKLEHNKVGLRNLLKNVYENEVDAAFIVFYQNNKWRFSYVSEIRVTNKETGKREKRKTDPKRYTYLMGEGERCKTAADRFSKLYKTVDVFGEGITLKAIEDAFSVEKLSKNFFEEYRKHYGKFTAFITGKDENSKEVNKAHPFLGTHFKNDEKHARDFIKKLLGRIVFLYFLEKKRWLGVPQDGAWGDGDDNFLSRLFTDCKDKNSFYSNVLVPLYFETLNEERTHNFFKIDAAFFTKPGYNKLKIPYLNGGLFDDDEKDTDSINFPADLFQQLFTFFDQYNFTVYEDSPDEHTVAVDPEMLGHIFENLLEDNKDKGAFYTPKEIVHYMCRESLIEYLYTKLNPQKIDAVNSLSFEEGRGEVAREAIEKLVLHHEAADIIEHEKPILKALKEVKICDPAIGSGAFPMGLLLEIFHLVEMLHDVSPDVTLSEWKLGKTWNPAKVKEEIIQNSIYGVDIEQGAVDIARLRFWLSLIVDETTPRPLPNLDYKIVAGDSLLSKFENEVIDIDWNIKYKSASAVEKIITDQQVKLNLMQSKQDLYFNVKGDKTKLHLEIRNLKIDILINQLALNRIKFEEDNTVQLSLMATEKDRQKRETVQEKIRDFNRTIHKLETIKKDKNAVLKFFDWKLDFPEVMNERIAKKETGFDIVIANPPYVEFKNLFKKTKDEIESRYVSATGKYDLYIPFLELPKFLMKLFGNMIYICPTRFMHRDYGKQIRNFITEKLYINSILDFGDAQIFENAMTYTGIFSFKNLSSSEKPFKYKKFQADETLNSFSHIEFKLINAESLQSGSWYFENNQNTLIEKIKQKTKPLISYCEGIYQGIATGKDTVFLVDKIIIKQYNLEKKLLHKILKGKDIGAYNISWSGKYVIYPYSSDGNVIPEKDLKNNFPNIYAYFKERKKELEGRDYFDKSKKLWFELWNQRNLKRFQCIKLVTLDTARRNSFAWDENNFVGTTTVYSLIAKSTTNLKYLLAVLNSSLLSYYHSKNTIPQAGGFYRYQALFIKDLPIKFNNSYVRPLENLINKILLHNGVSENELVRKLNVFIYKLYELTHEEASIIEGNSEWMPKEEYETFSIE